MHPPPPPPPSPSPVPLPSSSPSPLPLATPSPVPSPPPVAGPAKWPKIAAWWEDPNSQPSADFAGQNYDWMLLWFNVADTQAAAIKAAAQAAGRSIILVKYAMPQRTLINDDGTQPWHGALLGAASENWFLHNPSTDFSQTARVRDNDPSTPMWLNDVTNTAYANWIADWLANNWLKPNPSLDGLYIDGYSPNGTIGFYDRSWANPPTGDQNNSSGTSVVSDGTYQGTESYWWPAWMIKWLTNLKSRLAADGANNYIMDNSITSGAGDADFVDDTNIPSGGSFLSAVDGTFNEFYMHSYEDSNTSPSYAGDFSNWQWQQRRFLDSMNAGNDFVANCATSDGDPGNRWITFCLASFLLYDDGVHGYFGFVSGDQTTAVNFMKPIQSLLSGGPIGTAFINFDGNYERDFAGGHRVIVNPSGNTQGGLGSLTASIE